jgi:transcriptional regulator with XRE-family HTH domain
MPARQSKPRKRRTPAPVGAGLGERVRARARLGLSQAALGSPHLTRAFVSAIELGKVQPSLKSLEHLASKLGVEVGELTSPTEVRRDPIAAVARALSALGEAETVKEQERKVVAAAELVLQGALRSLSERRRAS